MFLDQIKPVHEFQLQVTTLFHLTLFGTDDEMASCVKTKLIILALFLGIATAASAEDGIVVALKGSVNSEDHGQITKLKIGSKVSDGATVSTGADALTVISLPDGTRVKLKEDSRIVLHVPAAAHKEPTAVELLTGAVFAAVRKHEGQSFQVRTKSAVAGVRGTEFFTALGEKDAFWLCVNEGSVDVTATGSKEAVTVPQGLGILIEKGKNPGQPKPYAWTKKLNWKMEGDVEDHSKIKMEYKNLLHYHYD